jgi:hypothetical protein
LPHGCVELPVQVWPTHEFQEQLALQVRVPPDPHASVAFGVQTPSPPHADHSDHVPLLHERVRAPQLPHGSDDAPVHVWPVHAPHAHAAVQVCVPPVPQACVAFRAHTPSSVQADHSDHCPLASHDRVRVPQLPHASDEGPSQVFFGSHWLHWHLPLQVRVPAASHVSVAFGVHAPWPSHALHSDHTPSLHVRFRAPQFPHDSSLAPSHGFGVGFFAPANPLLKWVGCAVILPFSTVVARGSNVSSEPASVQKTK